MSHAKKNMLSFFLTSECNLKCTYCYTDKGHFSNEVLDLEFAKYAIDEYISDDKLKHIRFFGPGEPTVEFGLMKELTKYAKTKCANLKVELQTNGVFDKSVREWLANNLDIIWISADGVPKIQDFYRPLKCGGGSAEFVEDNIRYLVGHGKGMTGIRTTITNRNMNNQIANIQYFSGLGVKYLWVDPIFPSVGDDESFYEEINLMEFAKAFLEAKKYANSNGVFYESILTCNFDERTTVHCRACLPKPHLTTDGYVSACDMALFGEAMNHMNVFIYGKWDRVYKKITYDHKKIENLRKRNLDNLPECADCVAKYHCAGYCLGEVQNETRDLFKRKTRVCEPIKYLYRELKTDFGCYEYLHP